MRSVDLLRRTVDGRTRLARGRLANQHHACLCGTVVRCAMVNSESIALRDSLDIAFESWIRLPLKQLVEITDAFKPYAFLWSLKEVSHGSVPSAGIDSQKHLLLDWALQRLILSHSAVRLFASHTGWNSLPESRLDGKPTLVWPQLTEQKINGNRIEHD